MNLLQVASAGFFDSLNPCNLAAAIILAVYLSLLRRYQCKVNLHGWTFVILSWGIVFAFLLGYFMPILYSDQFFQFGRMFFCALGVVYMLIGVFLFRSWINIRKTNSIREWILHDEGVYKKSSFVLPLFIPLGAFVLNALTTVWPVNRHITLLSYDLGDPEAGRIVLLKMALYSLMLMFPFVLSQCWIPLSSSNGWVAHHRSQSKIIASAVLLAIGFSLVYIFR